MNYKELKTKKVRTTKKYHKNTIEKVQNGLDF